MVHFHILYILCGSKLCMADDPMKQFYFFLLWVPSFINTRTRLLQEKFYKLAFVLPVELTKHWEGDNDHRFSCKFFYCFICKIYFNPDETTLSTKTFAGCLALSFPLEIKIEWGFKQF